MSTKDFQMFMTRANGAYFAKYKTPPKTLDLVEEDEEKIVFRATGKDKSNNDIRVLITFRK